MRLKKQIEQINKNIDLIKETLSPEIIRKAQKYDELQQCCKNIELSLDNVKYSLDDHGNRMVIINFSLRAIHLYFDEKGEVIKNDTFYSINMLDLVNKQDVKKIYKILSK